MSAQEKALTRRPLTQVPHLKEKALCCQASPPVLLGSHPGGNCSSPPPPQPKSHAQTIRNPGPTSELKLWSFPHCRPRHHSPHQLLSASSQRCSSMKALQLSCGRCPKEAWTENSFKVTTSTTLVPGISAVESRNGLTAPLPQWLKPIYSASNHAANADSLYWSCSSHRWAWQQTHNSLAQAQLRNMNAILLFSKASHMCLGLRNTHQQQETFKMKKRYSSYSCLWSPRGTLLGTEALPNRVHLWQAQSYLQANAIIRKRAIYVFEDTQTMKFCDKIRLHNDSSKKLSACNAI